MRMSLSHRIAAWFRALTFRRRFERDMDEEMQFHMEQHSAALMAQGIPRAEAHRQARIAFGGAESSRDSVRSVLGMRYFDELLGDLRYAVRTLRNSPGFTLIATASLALAIGANTTIFSVAHFLLIERLGVPHADQLRVLSHVSDGHSVFGMTWGSDYTADDGFTHHYSFTYPVFQQMQRDAGTAGVAIFAYKDIGVVNVATDGEAEAVSAELVSGNFYQQMQAVPYLGRAILPSDDGNPGTGAVAVLSYGFWQSAFGGAADIVGKTIRIDTISVTVIGVNAKGFTGGGSVQASPGVFLPMSMIAVLRPSLGPEKPLQSTRLSWISLMLRKPADLNDELLQERLNQSFHAAALATVTPAAGRTIPRLYVEDGSRGLSYDAYVMKHPLHVLLGMVGCVLLLACANVANLMLARATVRRREIGVRLALGAGRNRIFRQLLVESLVLAAMGGFFGIALGYLGTRATPALLQTTWDTNVVPIPFQWPVLAFTVAVTLLTGVLFGLAPALQATRTDVNTTLKQSAQSASRDRRAWAGKGLVAFQVALATLLVSASLLFVRSSMKLAAVHLGFDPQNLLLFQIQPPDRQYAGLKSVALHRQLLQQFAALPGVESVSATAVPLIAQSMWNSNLRFEGEPKPDRSAQGSADRTVNVDPVTPDFYRTMRLPILMGRAFSDADTPSSPHVAVVNRAFVRKFLHGQNAIGIRFASDDDLLPKGEDVTWYTIVGVCDDSQYSDLRTPPGPIYFTDLLQSGAVTDGAQGATYIVRSALAPAALLLALKRAALGVDPNLPLMAIRTQQQQIRDVSRQERLFATLTAGFGLLALTLACVGIYGVMAYTVSQRTHEIGIRLALGAERSRVRRMVLREASWISVFGIAVGVAAVLALSRLVTNLLYHLDPRDPASVVLSVSLLLATALLASWLPAARAAGLEPVTALRQD